MAGYYGSQLTDQYRESLKKEGHPYADLSDIELTQYISQRASEEGLNTALLPQDFQVALSRINNRTPDEYVGDNALSVGIQEFTKGLKSGGYTTLGGYQALGGMGAGAAGYEDAEDDLMLDARRSFEKASEVGSTMRGKGYDTLLGAEKDAGAIGRYLASGAGEALASTADLLVSVVAGLGAGAVVKKGLVEGAKKKVMSEMAERGVSANVAKQNADVLSKALPSGQKMTEAASNLSKYAAGTAGAVTGFATSTGQNTGHVYADLYPFTQEPEYIEQDGAKIKNPMYMSPEEAREKSLIAGAASGSLDSVVPAILASGLAKKIGMPKALKSVSDFVKKMPAGTIFTKKALPVLGVGGAEALTEATQGFIQRAVVKEHKGEEWDLSPGSEDFKALFEEGLLGFLGGAQVKAGMDAVGSIVGGTSDTQQSKDDTTPEQELVERTGQPQQRDGQRDIERAKLKAFSDKQKKFQVGDKVHYGLDRGVEFEVTAVHSDGKIDVSRTDGKSQIFSRDAGKFVLAQQEEETTEEGSINERISELEEIHKQGETEAEAMIREAKKKGGPEKYYEFLKKTHKNADVNSPLGRQVAIHKAQDALANENSTQAERVLARLVLAGVEKSWNIQQIYDIQKSIDKYKKGEIKNRYELEDQRRAWYEALDAEKNKKQPTDVDEYYRVDGNQIKVGNKIVGEIQLQEELGQIVYEKVLYADGDTDIADPARMEEVAKKAIRKRAEESELAVNIDKEGNLIENLEITEDLETNEGILSALKKAKTYEQGVYSEMLADLITKAKERDLLIKGELPRHPKSEQDEKLTGEDRDMIKVFHDDAIETATKQAEVASKVSDVTQKVRQTFDGWAIDSSRAKRLKQATYDHLVKSRPDLFRLTRGNISYVGKVEGVENGRRDKSEAEYKKKKEAIQKKSKLYPPRKLYNRKDGFVYLESFNEETGETTWYNPKTKEKQKKSWDDTKRIQAGEYKGKSFTIENGEAKYVPPAVKLKAPAKPKAVKTDRNLGYYIRKEEVDPQTNKKKYKYSMKTPQEVHKGTKIPVRLEREPIFEPGRNGEYDVIIGFRDGDKDILFGNTVQSDMVTESGETATINGVPIQKGAQFPIWKFNELVHARLPEGSTIYVPKKARGTRTQSSKSVARPARYEDFSVNSVITTIKPTELELVLTGLFDGEPIDGMTPAQYLASQLLPNLDPDTATDEQIKEGLRDAGLLSTDNLQEAGGYSKLALAMVTPEGRVIVRSIYFTHAGKGNLKQFGIGNYKMVVYQSQVKGTGEFNPRGRSRSGNPATDTFSIPVGDVEGSPFTEDTAGRVYVNGDKGIYRVIGFVKGNENFVIGNDTGNFLNLNGLTTSIDSNNDRAIQHRTPYTRFLNDPSDKDVRGPDGTYNPFFHTYAELSQRENAKEQIKAFAKYKKQQIEHLIDEGIVREEDFDNYLNILNEAIATGQIRIRELDAIETEVFSGTQNRKGSHFKHRENEYKDLDDSMFLIRRMYFSDKFGAHNDRSNGREQHRWFGETKEKRDPDTIKDLLFEKGSIPKQLASQLKKVYAKYEEVLSLRLFKNEAQVDEEGNADGIKQTPIAGVLYNYFFGEKITRADGTIGTRFEKLPQTEEEYNALARKIRDIRLMQDTMSRLHTNQEISGEIVDILQYYFFEAKDPDFTEAQEEINEAVESAIQEWNDTIKQDAEALLDLEAEANLLQEGVVDAEDNLFKQIEQLKEKTEIARGQIEMLETLREQVIEKMQTDPSFSKAVSQGIVPTVSKDAANELAVTGSRLGFSELSGMNAEQISSNLPAIKTAVDQLAEEQPIPMSIIEQADILNMSDTELSQALQGAMEGQNAPTGIGLLLFGEEGQFQDERKMDAWNHDINDPQGSLLSKALTTSGLDADQRKQLGFKEALQDGIDDDGAGSLAEDMNGGFSITTASEEEIDVDWNHYSELHEDPDAALQQDQRIKQQMFGTADPTKPISGKAILKRIASMTQNRNTKNLLDMLQPLKEQLANVDVVFATREQWAKRNNNPKKYRWAEYQPWSNAILVGDFHTKPNEDGTAKEDQEVIEFIVRTLAEELQHSVLFKTIDAMNSVRDTGMLPWDYKGKMTIKELQSMASITKTFRDFLKAEARKKGIFTSQLRNEQEIWANYASDVEFRQWIDSLEFDTETRRKLQTRFGRVKDFIVRLLSRIFSRFQESSALNIMDDHLNKFYEDSNVEASSGAALASQEMFPFMEQKKTQKLSEDVTGAPPKQDKPIPRNIIQAVAQYITWGNDDYGIRAQSVEEATEAVMQSPNWNKTRRETIASVRRTYDMLQDYQEMHSVGKRDAFQQAALRGELIKPRRALYSEEDKPSPSTEEESNTEPEEKAQPSESDRQLQAVRERTSAPKDLEQNIHMESVAVSEVMKVIAEVAGDLPEELRTEVVDKILKEKLSFIPSRGKAVQLKKALANRIKAMKLGQAPNAQQYEQAISEMAQEQDVQPKESIDEFDTLPLRMRAVDRSLRMMNSTRMWTNRFLNKRVNEAFGKLAKLQREKNNATNKLKALADKKKYNPESAKEILLEESKKLISQGLHQVITNEVADYGLARLANSINVNKLYDFLAALIQQGVAVEQYTAQEIYEQFNITSSDIFDGISGERQDRVAKALIAKLLGSDTKRQKRAKRVFSLDMRLAMDAPTRELSSEWSRLSEAINSKNWKNVSTDGLLGTQIQSAKQIRKELELVNKKIEEVLQEVKLARYLIKAYDKRIKLYKDYLGEVYMPEVKLGDTIQLLTIDKEGNVVPHLVQYDLRGEGLSKLLESVQQTRKILQNPELTTKIDEVYLEYFNRLVETIGSKPLSKIHHASVTGTLFSHLEPFVKILSRSGKEGMEGSSKLIQFFNEYRELMSEFVGQGQQVNLALEKLKSELLGKESMSDLKFREHLLDPFRTYVENRPETGEWEQAAIDFWNDNKSNGDFNFSDKGKKLWLQYVRELVIATNKVMKASNDAGLAIETDIMIVDPMLSSISEDGEVLKPLHRKEMPIGAITTPRFIYINKIAKAYNVLLRGTKPEDRIINHIVTSLKELSEAKEANRVAVDAALSKFKGLDPDMEMNFLDPLFMDDTNPRNLGYTIGKDVISMEEVREAWENSEGKNTGAKLADMMNTLIGDELTEKEYVKAVRDLMVQINSRAEAIIKTHNEIESQVDRNVKNPDSIQYGAQVWSSLNSRDESTKLPSSFFTYTMFTEMDMQRLLGKILQAKYFGRNREGLESIFDGINNSLMDALREYAKIQSKYTEYRTIFEDIIPDISSDSKISTRIKLSRRAKRILSPEDQQKLSKLHTEILSLRRAKQMQPAIRKFMNSNDESPEVDTQAFLETLQTIAGFAVSNPKSALNNFAQMWEIVNMYGMSVPGAKHIYRVLSGMPREAAISLMESFGKTILRNIHGEKELRRYWIDLRQSMAGRYASRGMEGELIDGKLFSGKAYRRLIRQLRNWRMGQGGVKARGKIRDDLKGVPGSLRTAIPFLGNPFAWASQALNKYTSLSILQDLHERVKLAASVLDELNIDPDDQSKELTPEEMGFKDTKMSRLVHGKYQIFERLDNILYENGTSITQLAQDYRRRRKSDRSAAVMTPDKMMVAWSIATHEISFDSSMAKARAVQETYLGRTAAPLLGWATSRLAKTSELSRDNKNEGRVSSKAILRLTYQFLGAGIPIGMAVVLLGELYDEEVLGKASSLGKVSPTLLLPFGIIPASTEDDFNGVAVIERLARTSSIGGIAQELGSATVLGFSDQGRVPRDPLQRILAVNLATSLIDVGANLFSTGGEIEYSSVVRPLMYATGLNGMIQAMQFATHVVPDMADMPVFKQERQVTDVISYRSLLRTYGRALDIELQKSGGGMNYRPTSMTLAIRAMERAAYANDRNAFMEAYRKAKELSNAMNPSQDIIDRFRRRNIRAGVSKYSLSNTDWNYLLSVMDDEDKQKIMDATSMHNYYLQLIGGTPSESRTDRQSIDMLRLEALR